MIRQDGRVRFLHCPFHHRMVCGNVFVAAISLFVVGVWSGSETTPFSLGQGVTEPRILRAFCAMVHSGHDLLLPPLPLGSGLGLGLGLVAWLRFRPVHGSPRDEPDQDSREGVADGSDTRR